MKKIKIFDKGVKPWGNDSVMRGTIYQREKNFKFKIKYNLSKGLKLYTEWIMQNKKS